VSIVGNAAAAAAYSRANPSPRYQVLTEQYRTLHAEGEKAMGLPAEKTFAGFSLLPQVHRIKALIDFTGAESIFDYGSGKGQQYEERLVELGADQEPETVMDYWDVAEVHCYDPNFPPFSHLPYERFDGVISTDVLEHCPEEDIGWILEEIFSYANRFVFVNIACFPAKKHLPNGENAHCTIRSIDWWNEQLQQVSARYPSVLWEAWLQSLVSVADANKLLEQRLSNFVSAS